MPDPNAPTLDLGGNSQALQNVVQAPSAQPKMKPSPLGSDKMPNIVRLISGMINPSTQQQQGQVRPPSRLDVFESFLGNFMGAMSQGLQNSGHGPGANARGFGYALTGAPQLALNQQQQQAETQKTQAGAQLEQAQAGQLQNVVQTPYGPMSQALASKVFPAAIAAQAKTDTQQLANQGKMSVEQMKMNILMGKVAKVVDGKDANGNLVKNAYNQQGQLIGTLQGALPSASYLPSATQTTEFKEDSNGNIIALPKTSSRGKIIPGQIGNSAQPSPTPSGFPKPQASQGSGFPKPNAGGPKVVALGKGAADAGTAIDPTTNELVGTTRAEAAQKGFQNFTKAGAQQFSKWRAAQTQFNDVQSNISRFTAAAQRFAKEGKATDGPFIDTIINKSGIFDMQLKIGEGGEIRLPAVSALMEAGSRLSRSAAYAKLSAAGKDLIDGYFRSMAAMPAWQRAITMSGQSSEHQLDLEVGQMPNPTMAPADILRKLAAFQENIDQGVQGIPRMKGMMTTKDVRQKFEGNRKPQQQFMSLPSILNR